MWGATIELTYVTWFCWSCITPTKSAHKYVAAPMETFKDHNQIYSKHPYQCASQTHIIPEPMRIITISMSHSNWINLRSLILPAMHHAHKKPAHKYVTTGTSVLPWSILPWLFHFNTEIQKAANWENIVIIVSWHICSYSRSQFRLKLFQHVRWGW